MLDFAGAGFFFVLGAILGSFANVIIVRLPSRENIALPASHCRKCKAPVAWYDNVPIISYLILRGRCRKCGQKFSIRYLIVEFLTAFLFALIYLKVGLTWTLLEYLIFCFGLVVVSFIDFDHMILPDVFTLSGIVIGIIGAWLNPSRSLLDSIWGVLVGGGFLWAIAYAYLLVRKQEGMGGGDIKLLGWIGAVLGWQSVPFVVISSSIFGTIVGLCFAARSKKGLQQTIPFGPYLALAAVLYILIGGHHLVDWYFRLHSINSD